MNVRRKLHCTSVSTDSFSASRFNKELGDDGVMPASEGEVGETTSSGVDGEVGRIKEEGVTPPEGSKWLI